MNSLFNNFTEQKIESSNHGKEKTPGAYIIDHVDGVYVGSTNDLYKRKTHHLSSLRNNKHYNDYLQECFNICPNFDFKVIITKTKEEALKIEQQVLDKYIESGVLFNKSPDAYTSKSEMKRFVSEETRRKQSLSSPRYNLGRTFSEETRRKNGDGHRGIKHSEEHNEKILLNNPKRVEVIIDNVKYNSIREAAREHGIDHAIVRKRLNSDDPKFNNWNRS